MPVSRRLLDVALRQRIAGLPGLTVYAGEVPDRPPVLAVGGVPDPSGRVAPYVVVWGDAGRPVDEEADLGDEHDDLLWSPRLTVAAGFQADALHTIDRVHTRIYRWTPALTGVVVDRLRPPPGFDPGPLQRDDAVSPARFYQPLIYQTHATVT